MHVSELGGVLPVNGDWYEFDIAENPKKAGKQHAVRIKPLDKQEAEREAAWASRDASSLPEFVHARAREDVET